jgi:predicted acyl esterase
VPVLGIAGWHDAARGTIRNYMTLNGLAGHPLQRVVMDAGAHKGIDYVNGDFGPKGRIDSRLLQVRWFDHYLKGIANGVAADEYRYDPGNPTPYLVDARELELNINEDYQAVHAERHDLLTYTTAPLKQDTEITGPMTATLWAATDARDTDWNVMILDVYPDGRALHIQDGVARPRFRNGFDRPSLLAPGQIYRYDIDL